MLIIIYVRIDMDIHMHKSPLIIFKPKGKTR